MGTIVRVGLDTSKSVFQLHGVDGMEQPVLRRKLRRGQVLEFFRRLPPAFVAMEACGASHYWARELQSLGHEVAMIPPQYVKPKPAKIAQELRADQKSRAAGRTDADARAGSVHQ